MSMKRFKLLMLGICCAGISWAFTYQACHEVLAGMVLWYTVAAIVPVAVAVPLIIEGIV